MTICWQAPHSADGLHNAYFQEEKLGGGEWKFESVSVNFLWRTNRSKWFFYRNINQNVVLRSIVSMALPSKPIREHQWPIWRFPPMYYLVSLRDWNLIRCSKCFTCWIQTKISEYFALRFFQFVTLLLESRDVLTLCWLLVYHTVPHGSATFHFTPNTLYHTDCQKFFQEMKLSCILFLTLSYALHSDASKEMEHFQIRVAAMLPRSQTNLPHSVKLYSTQFHNP